MNEYSLDILGKECKNDYHNLCASQWKGLGVEVSCNCQCHRKQALGKDVRYNHRTTQRNCHCKLPNS